MNKSKLIMLFDADKGFNFKLLAALCPPSQNLEQPSFVLLFYLVFATAPPVQLQKWKIKTAQRQEVWLQRRNVGTGSCTPPVHERSRAIQQVQTAQEAAALHSSNVWICVGGRSVCGCVGVCEFQYQDQYQSVTMCDYYMQIKTFI